MLASRHLDNMVTLVWIQISYSLSICDRIFMTEAKLSMVVHAPGEDLVGVIYVERVEPSSEDILGVFRIGLLDFEGLLALVSGLELSANLSRVSITPRIHFLALSQGHSVLCAANNLLDSTLGLVAEQIIGNSRRNLHFSS